MEDEAAIAFQVFLFVPLGGSPPLVVDAGILGRPGQLAKEGLLDLSDRGRLNGIGAADMTPFPRSCSCRRDVKGPPDE